MVRILVEARFRASGRPQPAIHGSDDRARRPAGEAWGANKGIRNWPATAVHPACRTVLALRADECHGQNRLLFPCQAIRSCTVCNHTHGEINMSRKAPACQGHATTFGRARHPGLPARLLLAATLTFTAALAAAQPVQVIDLRSGPGPAVSSSPGPSVDLDGMSLFSAHDSIHGRELWRSDGTPSGTVLVKDIHPGAQDSGPSGFVVLGSHAYFFADDGGHGRELWRSDGTEAGTHLVADIRPGRHGNVAQVPTIAGNTLYFSANDGVHGVELWRSDGSQAGTVMVSDIRPGPASSNPGAIRALSPGVVLFQATRDDVGSELFRSNGSAGGTVLVRDLLPGTGSGFSIEGSFAAVHDGLYYFPGNNGSTGDELYRSDGTSAGTQLVADMRPGADGASPRHLHSTVVGLLFTASTSEGTSLWRSHGTAATTISLGIPMSALVESSFARLNDAIVFADTVGALRRTDGTVAGTTLLRISGGTGDPTAFNGQVYFRSFDSSAGFELFRTDGTVAGTTLAASINPGADSSAPTNLRVVGDRLVFSAVRTPFGRELWQLAAGDTQAVPLGNIAEETGSSAPRLLGRLGDRVVFTAFRDDLGREPWISDGTATGTELLLDINPGPPNGMFFHDQTHVRTVAHQGQLYFLGHDSDSGAELWRTDGTTTGTVRVTEIGPGNIGGPGQSRYVPYFRPAGDSLYLAASTTGNSDATRLWRVDGTTGSAMLIHPDLRLDDSDYNPRPSAALGSTLLFSAEEITGGGLQLYRTDGTPASTTLVRSIDPSGTYPSWLTTVGNQVFFTAFTSTIGRELWQSDGTFAGTSLVKDVRPGPFSSIPLDLTAHDGILYFSAVDDSGGRELWRSDGTENGTLRLADVHPGLAGSVPTGLHSAPGGLFFSARHPQRGVELWRTDGTAEGTLMLADAGTGADDGLPSAVWNETIEPPLVQFNPFLALVRAVDLVPFLLVDAPAQRVALYRDPMESETLDDGRVVFRACSRRHGCQLWISDGSRMGTYRLTDMGPAPGGASPGHLTAVGQTVYFAATDELGDRELWKLAVPPADDVIFRNALEALP